MTSKLKTNILAATLLSAVFAHHSFSEKTRINYLFPKKIAKKTVPMKSEVLTKKSPVWIEPIELEELPDSGDLKYKIEPPTGDHVTDPSKNPFYLPDPKNIKKIVDYDPATGKYIVSEKVGDVNIKEPLYLTYKEYLDYTEKQERDAYFKSRADAVHLIEQKGILPSIDMKNKVMDRLFGSTKIEIKPQGNLEVILGGNSQYVNNPNIPIAQRKIGGMDFDMNINLSVVGKIGDKMQLGFKFNNQSGFAFDNQVKLGYTGNEDDIIKEVQLGNVSLPLPTRLITGSQALFGARVKLQFGRLTWTSVLSQQQSKKETVLVESGAQKQLFDVKSDQYDENRHFFLAQKFRDNYDYALSELPNLKSITNITRLEVWVTNRNGTTQGVRDVMAIQDMGEHTPFNSTINSGIQTMPDNGSSDLYARLKSNPSGRFIENAVSYLGTLGLNQGDDFEKTYARKLQSTEYTFQPALGFISLNSTLNANEVLAVAYQYEMNGKIFQVGEFANEVPPDSSTSSKVLYLKMLKGSSIRVHNPVWNLMMKNIYSLGAYQVAQEDFRLNLFYNDPGNGDKMYLPKGGLKGIPLIKVLNLDKLNANNDQQPDGVFDFVPGITILPQTGRIIFPVKEPFGKNLYDAMISSGTAPQVAEQYVYQQLYDSTKFIAQQFPEYNRFSIKGQYKGSNSRDISLGGLNIPKGSVRVSAGGAQLKEGVDYEVDYNLGRVTILNQGVLNSGQQIKIDFENNNLFASQQRSLMGTRLDYRVSKKFNIGGTAMHLSERPINKKVNLGEDPISNTMLGADIKYEANMPWLTRALDKLPFYSTKEMSTINAYGEVAHLIAGHNKGIGKTGTVYLDDFEGASTSNGLMSPITSWRLASTPRNSPKPNGAVYFPEADSINSFKYGFNRAQLSWYRIDQTFYSSSAPDVVKNSPDFKDNRVRYIDNSEIFPNRPNQNLNNVVNTFDLQLHPMERGPYNYENSVSPTPGVSAGVNPDGSLREPRTRWAGIMRGLETTDLESNNIEYIDFWMMDPFSNPNMQTSQGGKLYFNLGAISEDILRDSRQQFENGLSSDKTILDKTKWGNVPKITPLVNAFSNNTADRPFQDVGFDGYSTTEEKDSLSPFLSWATGALNPAASQVLTADPSSDDYVFYRDVNFDKTEPSILNRYHHYSNPENNSPINTGNASTTSGSNLPDIEDLNKDNTLNENEQYFQYELDMKPGMDEKNNKYIISSVSVPVSTNVPIPTKWLQFRIPIRNPDAKVGNIPDFKSIQFMRMFMTGWADSTVVLRFGTLDLIRNQWRAYNYPIDPGSDNVPIDNDQLANFSVQKVSIEENSGKAPVNYVLPPGIDRTYQLGNATNSTVAQNEQALSVKTCGLADGKSRAVFKNLQFDLRRYKHLQMFIHANRVENEIPVKDNDVTAFLRIGTDFVDNYYQYEIPLKMSPDGTTYDNNKSADRDSVWPASNQMDITLADLVDIKLARNAQPGYPKNVPFQKVINGKILTIVGNPDIGATKTFLLGIKNPQRGAPNNPKADDDGQAKCVEVWFNELRLSDFDEKGGTAAVGEVGVKLADLGRLDVTAGMHTKGFGQIEQKIDKRFKDDFYQYSVSSSLELSRFFPKKFGLRIPFYGGINQTFSTPEFDPFQLDINSKRSVNAIQTLYGTDSAKHYRSMIQTINTRRGFNFTGVRIAPLKTKKPRIYDPGNFTFSYAYNEVLFSDPYTQKNSKKNYTGSINWAFSPTAKEFTPFKKLIKSKSKWLDLLREFNFNLMPSTMTFSTDMNRDYGMLQIRNFGSDYVIPASYFKQWKWNRVYSFKYNPFKSLSFDYSANNVSRIDEPDGAIDTREKKDVLWNHIKQGGRNTNFNQTMGINYTLPFAKFPLLDFITANAGFNSTYSWTALPMVRDTATHSYKTNPLGNTVNNSMNDRAKVDLNFKKIYDKVSFLKNYNSPNPILGDHKEYVKKRDAMKKTRLKIEEEIEKLKEKKLKLKEDIITVKENTKFPDSVKVQKIKAIKKQIKEVKKQIKEKRKDLDTKQLPVNPYISIFLRPLLALKKVTAEYKETKSTTLPGFMPSTELVGNNNRLQAPGYAFALLGAQPGDKFFFGTDPAKRNQWLDNAATHGWITGDTILNQKFMQVRQTKWDFSANLELFPDFKIDLTAFRDYQETHTEFFKKIDQTGNWKHLNPMEYGSYSISYLPVKSFFEKFDTKGNADSYKNFEANRVAVSQRLGNLNPNSTGNYVNPSDTNPLTNVNRNYRDGYGQKSQDVLIPAFISAITHSDPTKQQTNLFKILPMPNWKISYNGLSKIKWLQNIFTNINFTHGYASTLSVNNFQTNLTYQKDNSNHAAAKDSLNNNFISPYNMLNVSMNEQFSPLLGIDVQFKNKLSLRFDYKKSRTVTLTFADYQYIENNSSTITAGAGYTIKGLKLGFIKIGSKPLKLENDLKFRLDVSFRDMITVNQRIDANTPQITSGSRTLTISPAIDYVINNRINVRLFVDYNKNTPKISTGFPITTVKGGLSIRMSLVE